MLNSIRNILTITLFSINVYGQENEFYNISKVNGASEINSSIYLVSDKFGNEIHKYNGTEISMYLKDGRMISNLIKDDKGIEKAKKKYKYDLEGRLNEVSKYKKGILIGKIIYSYTGENIVQRIEYGENGDPIDRIIYETDMRGRVIKANNEELSNEVIYNYTEFGDEILKKESIIGGESSETRTYERGNLVLLENNSSTDRTETVFTYTYDSLNNIKSVRNYVMENNIKKLVTDTENNIDVFYNYDKRGNYIQATIKANTIGIVKTIKIIKRQIKYY
jgi:hypothetical protein